ncbi:MAG: F0F1 ATP synthase subunit B [Planctomycetes bacterium]|nr:F0F1 ATP synthase subunit B [Planctomycetota bacterium]
MMVSGWMVLAAGNPMEPEAQVLLYTVIVFLVLLGLLWKFAWGPLMKALEEREERISKKISDAEAALKAANEKAAEYEKRILAAKEEAAGIIAEGKRDVEKVRDEIMAAANSEAGKTLDRAKREIALAKDAALQELRDRVVHLTADLASKVIEREVKADDHRRIIEEGITRIDQSRN